MSVSTRWLATPLPLLLSPIPFFSTRSVQLFRGELEANGLANTVCAVCWLAVALGVAALLHLSKRGVKTQVEAGCIASLLALLPGGAAVILGAPQTLPSHGHTDLVASLLFGFIADAIMFWCLLNLFPGLHRPQFRPMPARFGTLALVVALSTPLYVLSALIHESGLQILDDGFAVAIVSVLFLPLAGLLLFALVHFAVAVVLLVARRKVTHAQLAAVSFVVLFSLLVAAPLLTELLRAPSAAV